MEKEILKKVKGKSDVENLDKIEDKGSYRELVLHGTCSPEQ